MLATLINLLNLHKLARTSGLAGRCPMRRILPGLFKGRD